MIAVQWSWLVTHHDHTSITNPDGILKAARALGHAYQTKSQHLGWALASVSAFFALGIGLTQARRIRQQTHQTANARRLSSVTQHTAGAVRRLVVRFQGSFVNAGAADVRHLRLRLALKALWRKLRYETFLIERGAARGTRAPPRRRQRRSPSHPNSPNPPTAR